MIDTRLECRDRLIRRKKLDKCQNIPTSGVFSHNESNIKSLKSCWVYRLGIEK